MTGLLSDHPVFIAFLTLNLEFPRSLEVVKSGKACHKGYQILSIISGQLLKYILGLKRSDPTYQRIVTKVSNPTNVRNDMILKR